jgi:xylulokinase
MAIDSANPNDSTLPKSPYVGVQFAAIPEFQAIGLAVVGGGARSALWKQLLADAIGVPMRSIEGGAAGAALGASRLAWMADGGDERTVCRPAVVEADYLPQAAQQELLARRAERFRSLYPRLRGQFASPHSGIA